VSVRAVHLEAEQIDLGARAPADEYAFGPGTKSYIPYSSSGPGNLPSANGVPHMMFGYTTQDPVDPGPFLSLV
jgi:hypothetical protein